MAIVRGVLSHTKHNWSLQNSQALWFTVLPRCQIAKTPDWQPSCDANCRDQKAWLGSTSGARLQSTVKVVAGCTDDRCSCPKGNPSKMNGKCCNENRFGVNAALLFAPQSLASPISRVMYIGG